MKQLDDILYGEKPYDEKPKLTHITDDILRTEILQHTKDFKTSWVKLGQALYAVYNDKIYKLWGYEKFEYYTEKEVGLKKTIALKLLKSYYFLENEEPAYLKKEYSDSTEASQIPTCDTVNVLRLAKGNKDLPREEFNKLKAEVFEKGRDAVEIRKDLTTMMKERKEVDGDEEREKRNTAAVRRLLNAFRSFKRDIEVLKLLPVQLLNETEEVMKKLEIQIGESSVRVEG